MIKARHPQHFLNVASLDFTDSSGSICTERDTTSTRISTNTAGSGAWYECCEMLPMFLKGLSATTSVPGFLGCGQCECVRIARTHFSHL